MKNHIDKAQFLKLSDEEAAKVRGGVIIIIGDREYPFQPYFKTQAVEQPSKVDYLRSTIVPF